MVIIEKEQRLNSVSSRLHGVLRGRQADDGHAVRGIHTFSNPVRIVAAKFGRLKVGRYNEHLKMQLIISQRPSGDRPDADVSRWTVMV